MARSSTTFPSPSPAHRISSLRRAHWSSAWCRVSGRFPSAISEDADTAAYLARWDEVNAAVHDVVHAMGGSISAEHGIGRFKLAENRRFKDPVELELMRRIKHSFDPDDLFNPGKVI